MGIRLCGVCVAYCRFASDEGLAVNEVDDVCVSQPPFAFVWVQAVQGKACGITPSINLHQTIDSISKQHPLGLSSSSNTYPISQTLEQPSFLKLSSNPPTSNTYQNIQTHHHHNVLQNPYRHPRSSRGHCHPYLGSTVIHFHYHCTLE